MFRSVALVLCLPGSVLADSPRVVTDIAPVHGLAAMVMEGVAAPHLLLRPGLSPHAYAMRPSDARNLQAADVVFWVGPALTPWLEQPVTSLAGDAVTVELLDLDGPALLPLEEDDGHGDGHDEEHDEGHDEGHGDGHDHAGGLDPHAWLDPEIAALWVGAMAQTLSAVDPEHADIYRRNADAAQAMLGQLDREIAGALVPVRGVPFVAFHDAYRYFERRYGLTNAGTVTPGDASAPGAAHLAELQAEIEARGVRCAFSEPQFDPALLLVAGEKAGVRLAELDPMGAHLDPGPGFYPALMRSLAQAAVTCLTP